MALFDPRRDDRIGHGGTFNANPLTMAAGLATLDELTPDRFDALEALAAELEAGVNAQTEATATAVGSLFRIELARPGTAFPTCTSDLLANGILMTPRGMGCLSTPMTVRRDRRVRRGGAALALAPRAFPQPVADEVDRHDDPGEEERRHAPSRRVASIRACSRARTPPSRAARPASPRSELDRAEVGERCGDAHRRKEGM